MSEINWSALQTTAAKAGTVPDGDYDLVVVESKATTSSNGKPMLKVKFRVANGPHQDVPIWWNGVVSAESAMAMRMFFMNMAALGVESSFFASNPSMDVLAGAIMGRNVRATVATSTWNGVERNEIKSLKALASTGPSAPGAPSGAAIPSPLAPIAQALAPTSVPNTSPVAAPTAPPNSPF